jgi:glucose 1-dehydrogenase
MRALVTGVSEGIGGANSRQIAPKLGSANAMRVRQRREGVGQFADELRRQDCNVPILEGDLRDPAAPECFVESAAEQFGGLDAIVSNAGAVEQIPLEDMSLEVWDNMYALTWLLAKAGFPRLKASHGAIVAISSQCGIHPHRQTRAYSSAKAAQRMLCKQLAHEWVQHGVRVNTISPRMINTPLTETVYDDIAVTRQREAIVPLQRIVAPFDVARTVDFLIDPDNRYITSENIIVDGELTLSVLDRIPEIARRKESPL